jgi:hypothetical protein
MRLVTYVFLGLLILRTVQSMRDQATHLYKKQEVLGRTNHLCVFHYKLSISCDSLRGYSVSITYESVLLIYAVEMTSGGMIYIPR